MKPDVILWDYDGTLVNSVPKNINITKEILTKIAPRLAGDNLPHYLKSEKLYHIANHSAKNWQDLYVNYYGMSEKEMLEAGSMWSKYQLKNKTPVELFSGTMQTINQIKLPHGICSQNSSKNIYSVLERNNLANKFNSIIGYDDIPSNFQKPNPYGGLKCLKQILGNNIIDKTIFFVGDHQGDVQFARNIENELSTENKVTSIIVKYSGADTKTWTYKPDYEIDNPIDLLDIIR